MSDNESKFKADNKTHRAVVEDATTTQTVEIWEGDGQGGGRWVNSNRTTTHTLRKVNFE